MQVDVVLIWAISVGSIVCMLVRPRGIAEAYWVGAGAVLLVATRLVPVRLAGHAVAEGLNVYLFLAGMMLLSELARTEGVFDWIAGIAAARAKGSPKRLFGLIYVAGMVVTALLSNDATAVVLTPAVLAVVRKAKVPPKPYLLACALIANAASFVLPISNPANLVIFARQMPPLGQWLRIFLLPSVAAVGITFVCLRLLSAAELSGQVEEQGEPIRLTLKGRLALGGLVVSGAVLLVASGLGWRLGLPTCAAALVALLVVGLRDRAAVGKVVKGVSWSVLPLVAGLFVIVQALEGAGMLRLAVRGLEDLTRDAGKVGDVAAAFSVGLLSNVMNNLPVGLASGAAVQVAHVTGNLTNAVLIGVDLGPNLSVTGSLATILWLIVLRREQVEITAWEFLKYGMVAMPLALLGSVLLLR